MGFAHRRIPLDQNWLFGGKLDAAALESGFDDSVFTRVTLPQCATPLSWQNCDPASWENVWIYRRHFGMRPDSTAIVPFYISTGLWLARFR